MPVKKDLEKRKNMRRKEKAEKRRKNCRNMTNIDHKTKFRTKKTN